MASTASQSAFNRFLNHPAGPKTIHFWAPAGKWFLVIAGLADLKRPADQLSPTQAGALTATGLIWARYSTQIIPVNYSLMAVNLFVGATGMFQLYRIWDYRRGAPQQLPAAPTTTTAAAPKVEARAK